MKIKTGTGESCEIISDGVFIKNAAGYDGTNPTSGVNDIATAFVSLFTVLQNNVQKPTVIYETDGTTGLYGLNNNSINTNAWQLENLDFSGYTYVRCYFKPSNNAIDNNRLSAGMVVDIPLHASAACSSGIYLGAAASVFPNDRNLQLHVVCAIDSTKTKFQVVTQHSMYGTTVVSKSEDGRYCYRIEGHYD